MRDLSARVTRYMRDHMAMPDAETDQEQNWLAGHLRTFLDLALTAEREACAAIARAEAERCAERMATADQRQDIKTADMLEAQVVSASRIQQAIEARGDHRKP